MCLKIKILKDILNLLDDVKGHIRKRSINKLLISLCGIQIRYKKNERERERGY